MNPASQRPEHNAILKLPEFRFFVMSVALSSLATRALAVVIGYQIYKITHSPLALGWLGLIEAVPAISLSLFGGYVADRFDRRSILLTTKIASTLCAGTLALLSLNPQTANVLFLYAVVFAAGIARGFSDPAQTAFEARVIPKELTVTGSAWVASTWIGTSIVGPALAGFAYDLIGPANTYWTIGGFYALSFLCVGLIAPKPQPKPTEPESIFKNISLGLKFVFREQALVGSMALDLFAVFFGGAIALLPIFATDILQVGAKGLGLLNAAPAAGALLIMLWSTRRPPIKNAGRNLILCVAGFGVSMIVFAFSRNFCLSLLALALSGIFDGVSMIIRRSIVRLLSPEHLRGRIAAVSWVFIGASNELGAFESGVAAYWLGTVPAVWLGGVVTLLVVGITAVTAPKLRSLNLDPRLISKLTE